MTDYLTIAQENFIGRRWLYQEIESVFYPTRQGVSGVLIIGDPGAGKSALSAQLVCSRTSSRTIHDHVLGYHICKHSDKNTHNGGKFVRNLAEMIARRLPEYGYIVTNNSYIQRSLNTDCITIQDPVGCFEQAILTPLRRLKNEPKDNWYIVIDALDECLTQSETSHSIVYMINNKLPRFPSWLKLVMTSRNESSVSLKSNSVMKLIIDPEDSRNIEDIELYLSTKFYQDSPFIHQIKFWFGDNSLQNTARLISALLSKSQGNFLFVKEMLHHWETSKAGTSDPYALPETLGELYHSYFERLYNRREQFKPVRRVLELLVATFQPLTQKQIFDVLRMKEVNLEEDYDFKDRMKELGHFLRYGENGTVTLYHLSLTEWLTSESNKNGPFYVSKRKGHEVFCDFYFTLIAEGDKTSLSKYILPLAQHITYGGWRESYVKEFLRFPSQVVNSSDPQSNRTLLHLAATINSTGVLELLLGHFSCIDCIDNRGITPAFLAAEHGLLHNLALMVERGAKVNRKTKSFLSSYKSGEFDNTDYMCTPVLQSKSKFWSSTMLHAAAHGGHLAVVTFLLDNGAFISAVDGVNLTALQIAAENGHLGIVKALYEAGAIADQTALHHAAANNRLEVVKYLLQIGVTDRCMRCDGSFYWLKTKHRSQCEVKAKKVTLRINEHCLEDKIQPERIKDCIEEESITDFEVGELFDDKHLIFCETVLHAVVSAGHEAVVKELISKGTRALRCRDYKGRTPLHEAVRKNNSEIVKLLLKKDHTMLLNTCNHWQSVHEHNETKLSLTLSHEESIEYHHGDVCHCGYTPLHLAARYGHLEIGIDLIIRGALVEAQDCFGATPLHVSACHNHIDFVDLLTHSKIGGNINSRSRNGSTPLHSAAICGALEVTDKLLYHGANLSAVDDDGLSVLHYAILQIHPNQLKRNIIFNRTDLGGNLYLVTVDRRGHLANFYHENNMIKNTDHYRWLDAFINLILRGSNIDAVDIHGRTPLHIAAANGLADSVNVLLQSKAKLDTRDKFGKTPLELAVENSTVRSTNLPVIIGGRFNDMRQYLRNHEMVVYLLLSSGASFTKCNRSGTSLLHHAVAKRQPYIAQLLLLKGASLNCRNNLGRTPLTAFIHDGGDWADIPFDTSSVTIKCGKPFLSSAFHLLCYLTPKLEHNNFFKHITCDDQTCSLKKSPFIRAVESHRLKYKVFDSCLDAEGFTPLHRAAQGANLVAVRSLIEHGANMTFLSPQELDALALAILHSGEHIWQHLVKNEKMVTRKDNASAVAIELLRHAMKTSGFQMVCDSSKPKLTLYHLAASRGLVKFIKEMFKEQKRHQLDVNCPNRDGITPLYLAKVFSGQVVNGSYNPWKEVVRIIEDHGGRMLFPSKDVEYNVIYNRLLGWIPNDLELNLRPDVRGFVLGLVSSFQHRQNISVHCKQNSLGIAESVQIGDPSSIDLIRKELLVQLKLLNQKARCDPEVASLVSLALNDMKLCQLQYHRSVIYMMKFSLSTAIYFSSHVSHLTNSTKFGLQWAAISMYGKVLKMTPINLFYLMRIWHNEVFQHFPCIKIVLNKYRPIFLDDKQLKQLTVQYQQSAPIWYLGLICFSFEVAFLNYVIHYSSNTSYNEFAQLYHKFPDFIRERMGWTVDQLSLQNGSWPFDFLVKFSLGLYRQYDYLKVLNVGLEPGTHIRLYSDKKLTEIMRRVREKEKEKDEYISFDDFITPMPNS